MAGRTKWCRACDAPFLVAAPTSVCPRCGAPGEDPFGDGIPAEAPRDPLALDHSLARGDTFAARPAEVPASAPASAPADPETPCPACAEKIKLAARICRFCGTDVIDWRNSEREARREGRRFDPHRPPEEQAEARRKNPLDSPRARAARSAKKHVQDLELRRKVNTLWRESGGCALIFALPFLGVLVALGLALFY